jgi:hypothetical protein
MSPEQFKITISSPPDREHLVAEVFTQDPKWEWAQWAEINEEGGTLSLEIYPRPDGKPWVFSFSEALQTLVEASHRLKGHGGGVS